MPIIDAAYEKGLKDGRADGYKAGAKETKERILTAIDMAGLMTAKFGNDRAKTEAITELYLLVKSIPVE